MKKNKRLIDYHQTWWSRSSFWITLIFLYAPIITLIVYSFNDSKRNIVWKSFTLKYYFKALDNEPLLEAIFNSILIAISSTFFSLILGFLTAYSLWRFKFFMKAVYEGALSLPIVIPEITMGVAMLIFFNRINWPTDFSWPLNLSAITISHITFTFPFVALLLRARLQNFNTELEEAAMDLGASKMKVIRNIVIPYLKPAFITSAILSFTLSIDDFVITFFTANLNTVTFPIKVYSMVRFSVTPEVNAISTIMIFFTFLLAIIGLSYNPHVKQKSNKLK